jgi:hypothetical protein
MKNPTTYKEWIDCLQLLKDPSQENQAIEAMKNGELKWQSGVAERFTKQLFDVVNYRLNLATKKFQKQQVNTINSESNYVQALLGLRKELQKLEELVTISAIPEAEQRKFRASIKESADNMQQSLEDSAKSDYSGKLLSIVKNHRVN